MTAADGNGYLTACERARRVRRPACRPERPNSSPLMQLFLGLDRMMGMTSNSETTVLPLKADMDTPDLRRELALGLRRDWKLQSV